MSNIFGNLSTDGMEEAEDVVGGGGGGIFPSGIYLATVKMAYAGTSSSSAAQCINFVFDIDGKEYKEQLWVTNKKGENFYTREGKKHPLPGFVTADEIMTLANGKGVAMQLDEEKVIRVYSFAERKDVDLTAQVFTEVIGKQVKLAIQERKVNKQAKDSAGVYQDTNESRSENQIEKAYRFDTGRTVNEYKRKIEEPIHHDKWLSLNEGKVRDLFKAVEGNTGSPLANGAGAASGAGAAPLSFD